MKNSRKKGVEKRGEKIFQKKRENEKIVEKCVNNRVYIRGRMRKGVKKRGERERGNKREG